MRIREPRFADTAEAAEGYAPLHTQQLTPQRAGAIAEAFKALGDPVRLRILNLLLTAEAGEISACDLVAPSGRSQPTVSHHLKVLREVGLVNADRRGTWIYYSVVPERLTALTHLLNPGVDTARQLEGAA